MDNLIHILKTEIKKYTGEALNGYSYLAENTDQCLMTVISIGEFGGKHISFADLIVRVVGDKIVIDDDRHSIPFYESLMQAGIPREQIILAYAGEPVPDTV